MGPNPTITNEHSDSAVHLANLRYDYSRIFFWQKNRLQLEEWLWVTLQFHKILLHTHKFL